METLVANFLGRKEDLIENVMNYIQETEPDFDGDLRDAAVTRINAHAYLSASESCPAMYIGTYHKYNCGSLFGMWIDVTSFYDVNEFLQFCKAIHFDEKDPELMAQDFENYPRSWYSESGISEYFDKIQAFGELDEEEQEIAEAWMDEGHDFEDWDSHYHGKFDSEEDFAEQYFDEIYCGQVPEFLEQYIDYSKFARELFSGEFTYVDGYVFCCA